MSVTRIYKFETPKIPLIKFYSGEPQKEAFRTPSNPHVDLTTKVNSRAVFNARAIVRLHNLTNGTYMTC